MNDSVSMPAQGTTRGAEGERFGWRELKTGGNKLLARALLEIVPSVKDFARPRGERGFHPPIELAASQTPVPDN